MEDIKFHLQSAFNEVNNRVKLSGSISALDIRLLIENGIPYTRICKASINWLDFSSCFNKWLRSFITSESSWVSVGVRLPIHCDEVLICRSYGGDMWLSVGSYVKVSGVEYWYDHSSKLPVFDVLYWQELNEFRLRLSNSVNLPSHKSIVALKYDMDGKFHGEYPSKSAALRTYTSSNSVGWGEYRNGYILFKKVSDVYPLNIEPFSVLSKKQLLDYYVPASELQDRVIHESCIVDRFPTVDREKLCIDGKYTNIKHRFTVYQYSLDGDLLESYDSIRDAAKSTNIRYSQIYNCLTGMTNTAGGYIWKKDGGELD